MRPTWTVCRQFSPRRDGDRRWDQAYQLLVRWTAGQDDDTRPVGPRAHTGSFLVEALRTIHATRAAEVGDAFIGEDVKRAALERVIGFEILPAPFVVAHLQLGLLLQQLGAPLTLGSQERAAVYLTNALTGWTEESHAPLTFPGLEKERDAAATVKRDAPILVVLGNPPYNAFAGVSPAEEGGLVDLYKQGLGAWAGGTKQSLDDLYVRFLRIAERRITDLGRGVVCLISNFSYLADPSHVIVRQRLLGEFDQITIDCLNGDSRETGKKTP
jgi:predicted helicase